jgi:hypothetical protein
MAKPHAPACIELPSAGIIAANLHVTGAGSSSLCVASFRVQCEAAGLQHRGYGTKSTPVRHL